MSGSFWSLDGAALAALCHRAPEAKAEPGRCPCCGGPMARRRPAISFKGYDDFIPAWRAAIERARAVHGHDWAIQPGAAITARVPAAWVACRIFGGFSRSPRDMHLPAAEFWPAGQLPRGPEYPVIDHARQRAWAKSGGKRNAAAEAARQAADLERWRQEDAARDAAWFAAREAERQAAERAEADLVAEAMIEWGGAVRPLPMPPLPIPLRMAA